jgi:GH24 family phage-related lysozyme (muramidase)
MPSFTLPSVITEKDLIEFDLFPVADLTAATELVPLKNLEASNNLINFMLRSIKWRGYVYLDSDNQEKIGYNLTKGIDGPGLTEAESYRYWIEDFKDKERRFKKLMVLDKLSQSQYDGLLSMFYHTGDYTAVGSDIRKFKLMSDIQARRWNYVATAMSNSGVNRTLRQLEAKIIMLADYGVPKDRSLIKEQSLQEIVKRYPSRLLNDLARSQAEYVYYAETGRFLPKTSESRKRILSRQLNR